MQTLSATLAILIFTIAAYGDIRRRKIPNEVAITIVALGVVRLIAVGEPLPALYTIGAASALLLIGFLLFARGLVGGGDAKLLAATTLVVGYQEVPDLLLIMSVCGGVLALLVVLWDRLGALLRRVPLVMSFYGAPLRFAVGVEERLERWFRLRSEPEPEDSHSAKPRLTVPYGVAIAGAGILILVLDTYA